MSSLTKLHIGRITAQLHTTQGISAESTALTTLGWKLHCVPANPQWNTTTCCRSTATQLSLTQTHLSVLFDNSHSCFITLGNTEPLISTSDNNEVTQLNRVVLNQLSYLQHFATESETLSLYFEARQNIKLCDSRQTREMNDTLVTNNGI